MTETVWHRSWAVVGGLAFVAFVLWVYASLGWHTVELLQYAVAGLGPGAAAALVGVGIVLTYQTTGVFNFAFGPMATLSAYLMYELAVVGGVPSALAAIITIAVFAPLMGASIERLVFRPLQTRSASTSEQLLATIAVFAVLLGTVVVVWGAAVKNAPLVFGAKAYTIGSLVISSTTIGEVASIAIGSAAVAALMRYTRLGRQIRAVVDRRQLAELMGVRANRVASVAWMIGAVFAALAGVMYAPVQGLAPFNLTLEILETFSVVVIARLRSTKAAIIGGLVVGISQSLAVKVQNHIIGAWQGFGDVVPYLFVLALPIFLIVWRDLDEAGSDSSAISLVSATIGRRRRRNNLVAPGAVIAAVMVGISFAFGYSGLQTLQQLIAYAAIFLSIVAITGFSGQIMLGAAAFAGLSAMFTAKISNGMMPWVPKLNTILAMLLSAAIVTVIGVITGFPALKRRGLVLGLATLAINLVVYFMVFQNNYFLGGTSYINRPKLFGLSLVGDRPFYLYELVVLALALFLTGSLRSGRLGRILAAMRDSPTGAESIGINMRRYKVFIFGASSFLAAIGGSLFAQQEQTFQANDWTPIFSLFWFLAVVFVGLSYLSGGVLAAGLVVGLNKLVGQSNGSFIVIGILTLFTISFLRGGVIGWSLTRGPGVMFEELPRRYAEFIRRRRSRDVVDEDLAAVTPSRFAERLLGAGR